MALDCSFREHHKQQRTSQCNALNDIASFVRGFI